jgi:hypothetical protein
MVWFTVWIKPLRRLQVQGVQARARANQQPERDVDFLSLFKDRSGSLWIGCEEFLDKFDPVSETFTHYRIDANTAHGEMAPVTHISQDQWVCCGCQPAMDYSDSTPVPAR